MTPKEFLQDECNFEVTKNDRKIEIDQSRLLAMLEGYAVSEKKKTYTQIIKEEYEKRYGTQKYEDSVLRSTFESIVISAMQRV